MKKAGILLIGMFLVAAGYAALSMNDIIIPEQALPDAFQTAFSQLAAAFSQPAVESPGALPASSTFYFFANGQRIAKRTDGEMFYFHNDHLGSAAVVTDSAGQIVEEKMYDPFGMDLAGSSKIGYNSKELDKDTELNYYGARYYAADFGRFVTPDTVKGKIGNPQSLNLYAYTLNNPVKFTDPSGNQESEQVQEEQEKNKKKSVAGLIFSGIKTTGRAINTGVWYGFAYALTGETALHESSHALAYQTFGVGIDEFSITPNKGKGVMGYVRAEAESFE